MPDDRTFDRPAPGSFDIDPEIEALLAELDVADLELVTPPDDVWSAIERQLGAGERPAATDPSTDLGADQRLAPVVDLGARRRNLTVLLAAAAVALLVAGAVAVIGRGADSGTVLATARLDHDAEAFDPLGADSSATARLVERDGVYEIVLDDTVLPDIDAADLELWLIEADDSGAIVDVAPVSLVDGAGTYEVPAGLDVTTHRIVDISIEPRDGDEAHSGRSILRGTLPSA